MGSFVTVYFDTNFYVWLANATDSEAERVLSDLKNLRVRHVLSGQVILELLSNTNKSDKDKILINRVAKFEIEPLRVSSNSLESPVSSEELSWEILSLKGEERKGFSEVLRSIFDLQTQAESWSREARRQIGSEPDPKVQKSIESFMPLFGFETGKEYSPEETAQKFGAFSGDLLKLLSEIPGVSNFNPESVTLPTEFDSISLENLSSELKNSIGTENIAGLKEKDRLIDSTTASDNRPYKVVINEASRGEERGLGNTFRDSNNISLFVAHREEIDLLHLDGAQRRQIDNQRNPVHRIVELGLANRCFSSSSLANTVEIILEKKTRLAL